MSGLFATLAFLTRLPLPPRWVAGMWEPAWFPAAGSVIGILLVGVAWLGGDSVLALPAVVSAWLIVLVWVWVTGGLHLDGLMDTADGMCSGKSPEEALSIMRDSRVGAMGVLAALLLLIGKFVLILSLAESFPVLTGCLILIPIWSRWGMALALAAFPYGRSSGLGSTYFEAGAGERRRRLWGATIHIAILTGLVVGLGFAPLPLSLSIALSTTLVTLIVGVRWTSRFGGLTGDMYGALNEFNEVLALFLGVVFFV